MKNRIQLGVALPAGLLTAMLATALLATGLLLSGCDTASHGSPTASVGPKQPNATADQADKADGSQSPADVVENGATQQDAGETQTAELQAAEPMPRPVRGNSGEVVEITFDDVNLNMQADMVFRPWLVNDRVKELDGRRVRISGVMYPPNDPARIKEFVLLKNIECKFGPGGQADHLMQVKLKGGATAKYSGDTPISVEGVLRMNPFQGPDGNTWSIYDLEAADSVTTVRR